MTLLTARVFRGRVKVRRDGRRHARWLWICYRCPARNRLPSPPSEHAATLDAAQHNAEKHDDGLLATARGDNDPFTVTAADCPDHGTRTNGRTASDLVVPLLSMKLVKSDLYRASALRCDECGKQMKNPKLRLATVDTPVSEPVESEGKDAEQEPQLNALRKDSD